ncbi:ABC transporter ATP-binding protein [Mycoplasmopsis cynos]|uniref:ABC transporter ATP-binding protein n=1 Tax=Mycoplasmopsis cynos TaxID=171284 RepID=UPI002AFE058C|nr:ABC transporter ATP-binding protein [Mycoplasmopsis cynos]WQQ16303.1 ABC transporter ATP-binding protein [Mycoplasmopsis cynos]
MIKMFKILPKKIKLYFLFGVLVLLTNVGFSFLIPIFISQFLPLLINQDTKYQVHIFKNIIYESNNFANTLTFLIIITIVLIILSAITSILSTLVIVWAGENASNFYRNTLYTKYQKLSLKDISHYTIESLMTRINDDVGTFWDFLVGATTSLIKAPLFIFVGLIFAFLTDVTLTWTIVAIVPLLIGLLIFILKKVMPHIVKSRKIVDQNTKSVSEIILGARFIKAYNLQKHQFNKFKNTNKEWSKNGITIFNYFSLSNPFFFFAINLIIVLIYIGAYKLLTDNPNQDVGQLIAKINTFIEFEFFIGLGVGLFSQFVGTMFRARVSSKRIMEILNAKYENLRVKDGLLLEKNISNYPIEFKDFSFKYYKNSEHYALENINFYVPNGKTLGIIGPTGSGKSTIANLLINNMKYSTGNIKINNYEVSKINSKSLHQNIGIIYQDALLFSGTIKSNLLFANKDATDNDIYDALDTACASEFVNSFNDKLEHKIEQRGKNLSGGQKQRLAIARTLLANPKVLILDDTTSALDNITARKVLLNIKENYNCTTIIISQKINSIRHADKIIVLDNGKIIAYGTHDELLNSCEWYQDVYQNQLEQ